MSDISDLMARSEHFSRWCYDEGHGRLETPTIVAIDKDGKFTIVQLMIEADTKSDWNKYAIGGLRSIIKENNLIAFAVLSEAWVLRLDNERFTSEEREEYMRISRTQGNRATGLAEESFSIFAVGKNGHGANKTWMLHYDDMKNPRLGEVIAEFKESDKSGKEFDSAWFGAFEE